MSRLVSSLKSLFHPLPAPRLMLFIPCVLLKLLTSGVSGAAFILNSGPLYIAGMVLWVLWIGSLLLIALPQTDRWLAGVKNWLKPVSLALASVLVLVGVLEFAALSSVSSGGALSKVLGKDLSNLMQQQSINLRYNDGTALCHQAVDNLLAGENPYERANIVTANLLFGNPFDRTTPIQTGLFSDIFPYPTDAQLKAIWDKALQNPSDVPPEIESKLNYPAASFLLPAPFIAAGVSDIRWTYLGAVIAGFFIALFLVPANTRLWLLAGGLASLEIWESIASGETGSLMFPFLLLAFLTWRRRPWLSALCMGVAIATKQVAWFFLPFYLILIWRTVSFKKAAHALVTSAGVFLAINLAFIVQNPGLWLSSIMAPMTDKFFPLGVGPVTLVISGYIDIKSPLFFTIVEVAVFIALLAWYWINARRYPLTGIVLAVIPLFFAWRSSWWYFFYFDIILLAAVAMEDYQPQTSGAKPVTQTAFGAR
jgi:hypothetical protein